MARRSTLTRGTTEPRDAALSRRAGRSALTTAARPAGAPCTMTDAHPHAADPADTATYAAREADWRCGAVIYQVLVDRFAPSANLDAKRALYPAPKRLRAWSEVLEMRESRSRPTQGIVKVRTVGVNQDGTTVIEFKRTVMVYKRGHGPNVSFPGLPTEAENQ